MLIVRLAGILAAIAVGAGILAYFATRDRRYLQLSWMVTKFALALALAILVLFALERMAVL